MFYLKNDDMEELFRKAAENYELDASKASDWDSIHKRLHETSADSSETEGKKKKKRRFIFWWFLLFPAGWMAHNTWDKIGKSRQEQAVAQNQVTKTDGLPGKNASQPQPEAAQRGDETNDNEKTSEPENTLSENNEFTTNPGSGIAENTSPGNNNNAGQAAGKNKALKDSNGNPVAPVETEMSSSKRNEKPGYAVNKKQQTIHPQRNAKEAVAGNEMEEDMPWRVVTDQEGKTGIGTIKSSYWTASLQKVEERKFVLPTLAEPVQIPVGMVNGDNVDASVDSLNKTKDLPTAKSKDHYFYVQAMFAPDLTNIKFQRLSGVGTSAGLLVGYRFNKRFHVEAGGFWEKKVYYTDGKYFDKSKLPYFRDHEIYNVDGNCSMITIPVNLRYNFISKKNSDWFVTTGAAAYLMQKEYYDITYEYYGDARTRGWAYKDPPKSWLTTVNIGIGYQTTVLRSFNFRVEPYYRIPVSGAGTGSLSLTSAGIYVGIGRKF
ncbi:MAG: outer membrane beta-barrel protein [Agriterribacter sp.]